MLANQIGSWCDIESYGASKQVDPSSEAVARAEKLLQEITYHDESPHQVNILWADDQFILRNNFSALFQLKALNAVLGKIRT